MLLRCFIGCYKLVVVGQWQDRLVMDGELTSHWNCSCTFFWQRRTTNQMVVFLSNWELTSLSRVDQYIADTHSLLWIRRRLPVASFYGHVIDGTTVLQENMMATRPTPEVTGSGVFQLSEVSCIRSWCRHRPGSLGLMVVAESPVWRTTEQRRSRSGHGVGPKRGTILFLAQYCPASVRKGRACLGPVLLMS